MTLPDFNQHLHLKDRMLAFTPNVTFLRWWDFNPQPPVYNHGTLALELHRILKCQRSSDFVLDHFPQSHWIIGNQLPLFIYTFFVGECQLEIKPS